ncbi:MAG TPA: DUF1847 domain-containing protein [Desulfobacteria bacterium]|nr:DUF1847 domain-containing protein [Desulfobacteria bacterium]
MSDEKVGKLSCSDCGVFNCHRQLKHYPDFCLTTHLDAEKIEQAKEILKNHPEDSKLARIATEIEGKRGLTRVEETIAFAKRMQARKIGIATCIGTNPEAKIFAKILKAKGFEPVTVLCKVGSVDKTDIGVPEEFKIMPGKGHEACCNPVLQAMILNSEKTDLNVIIGLCAGHDYLFMKYSDAPATVMMVKDRVLGHNPAAALYNTTIYYKHLLEPDV